MLSLLRLLMRASGNEGSVNEAPLSQALHQRRKSVTVGTRPISGYQTIIQQCWNSFALLWQASQDLAAVQPLETKSPSIGS